MSRHHLIVAALALCLCALPAAQAQVLVPLLNGNASFEDNNVLNGEFSGPPPVGWDLYDPDGLTLQDMNVVGINAIGVLNPAGTSFFLPGEVPHGNNVALVYLEQRRRVPSADPGSMVGLFQSFAGVLEVNTQYMLTVGIGNIASGTGLGASFSFGFADLSGFPGYRVELLAGDQVIAADDNNLTSIAEGTFQTSTVMYTSAAMDPLEGSVLGVRLINLNAFGNEDERAREVDFDNVQLFATAVPEPRDYAMWLAGLGMLFAARLRYRARHTI